MLNRVHIQGFKSLRDVVLSFAPLTVVFGPNATGKSNLLEALLLLSRLVSERTLAEAFSGPVRGYPHEAFTFPPEGLEGLLTKDRVDLSMEATIRPSGVRSRASDALLYGVRVGLDPSKGTLSVLNEHLARLKRDGSPKNLPRIEGAGDHLLVRRLSESGQPRREPIGLNHTVASNLQYTGPDRYPDFDAVRSELVAWRSYYLDPQVAMRAPQPPRDVTDIGSRGEWLAPFLFRLKNHAEHRRSFLAIQRGLRAAIPSIEAMDVDLDPRRGTLDVLVRQHGVTFSSRLISEGTLRVLALCAIAANPWPGALVAFEEPENGVHPNRIEVIAQILIGMVRQGGRQVVVTTHSPTLVSAIVQLQRRVELADTVSLVRSTRDGPDTRLAPFDSSALFADGLVQEGLRGAEDDGVATAMLTRGWL